MQKLRAGIVGTGFMAGVHAGALQKIDGVEVAAVCSRTEESGAAFCKKAGLELSVHTDFDTMLARESLDIVYICLPPHAHRGEVQRAAAAGLALFLEKPLALRAEDARNMVEAIERAGVVSQVGYMMRFRKSVQTLKRRIDAGALGRPSLFTGRFWVNMEGSEWWRDAARSGGQLFEQVTHLYDLAMYLFGDVASAEGRLTNLLHTKDTDYTGEDTSVGFLQFENGALASITGSNCAVPVHFFADFRVVFEKGTLDYRCNGQPWVEPDQAFFWPVDGERETIVEDGDAFLEENRHFIECVRTRTPTLCPAREGLRAVEVTTKIIDASR